MTDAELTLLCLLAEHPRYGHELQQIIDERGLRDWVTIGFSSIYYILNKLEKQNLLTSTLQPNGRGPARKQYDLTQAGRGVLQTAVANLLREPRGLGAGFELGLANLHVLKPDQVYYVLQSHRDQLRDQLAGVQLAWSRHQKEGEPIAPVRALFTHSIAMMTAELAWLDDFLTQWRAGYPEIEEAPRKKENPDPHTAPTMLSPRNQPDRAKMLQRLRRLPPKEE